MRRITAILLLCAFSFQGIGYVLVYKVQRRHFRSQMQDFLSNNPETGLLTSIIIQAGQQNFLEWEHASEFRYQGQMYDVIQTRQLPGGATAYRCIPDDDETAWLASYQSLLQHSHPIAIGSGHRPAPGHNPDLLKLLFGSYYSPPQQQLPSTTSTIVHHPNQPSIPATPHLAIVSPPPRS